MGRVKEELFDKYQADQEEERYFKALEKAKDWEDFCTKLIDYHYDILSSHNFVKMYNELKEKHK